MTAAIFIVVFWLLVAGNFGWFVSRKGTTRMFGEAPWNWRIMLILPWPYLRWMERTHPNYQQGYLGRTTQWPTKPH